MEVRILMQRHNNTKVLDIVQLMFCNDNNEYFCLKMCDLIHLIEALVTGLIHQLSLVILQIIYP